MSFARVAEPTVTRIHDWIKCRDFLGDVLVATDTNAKQSIYGFSYDPKKDMPIDKNNLTLLLKFPNTEMLDNFRNNLVIIDTVDADNMQQISKLSPTDDPLIWVLQAGKFWQKNIPLISFYTFLLKCMCVKYDNPNNWQTEMVVRYSNTNEARYINDCGKYLDIFCKNCYTIFVDDTNVHGIKSKVINRIHNDTGFVSICKDTTYTPNTHHERLMNYVNGLPKTTKRVARKPKKVAKALDPAAPAFTAGY
jgi:hypothetical protein